MIIFITIVSASLLCFLWSRIKLRTPKSNDGISTHSFKHSAPTFAYHLYSYMKLEFGPFENVPVIQNQNN
jgi:hypothetical protein